MSCDDLSLNPGDGLFKTVVAVSLVITALLACTSGILCQVIPHICEPFDIEYARPDDMIAHAGLATIAAIFLAVFVLNCLLMFVPNRRLAAVGSLLVFLPAAWFLGSVTLVLLGVFVRLAAPWGPVM